uniref:Uncharacterized protein n=1 Tax=Coccidioides posadasii RMSCC 3488 TaxID=454284 RepID=A0A0J6FPU2_COCPO|nr:hypothetical protein CPAG_08697 [Coccidioides posadasii RMSCC 3488]
MEHSMFDDSMEVTSNHPEIPADDDIEIDLDIYQDRAENSDNDVVVEDASATASHHPDMSEDYDEHARDADMIDDNYSAAHLPDPDDPSNRGNRYGYDETKLPSNQHAYEGEMVDDYEEDIDAPIPGNFDEEEEEEEEGGEGPSTLTDAHPPDLNEPQPSKCDEGIEDHEAQERFSPVISQVSSPPQPIHDDSAGQENEDVATGNREAPSIDNPQNFGDGQASSKASPEIESSLSPPKEEGDGEAVPKGSDQISAQDTTGPPEIVNGNGKAEDSEATAAASAKVDTENIDEQDQTDEIRNKLPASHPPDDKEDGAETGDTADYIPLHRVTVLYQDSEMSLFPPNESDPSEMYLLEDEELAHAPLYQLFQAFRKVLGNNVSDEDELVASIDCLYIQLSEVATQSSEINLSQIVQLYLDLSRNDGVDNPEPLYICLSSRPILDAELAALQAAVDQGKGLSHLWEWDGVEGHDIDGPVEHPEVIEDGFGNGDNSTSQEDLGSSKEIPVLEESLCEEEDRIDHAAMPHVTEDQPATFEDQQNDRKSKETLESRPDEFPDEEEFSPDVLQDGDGEEQGEIWENGENHILGEVDGNPHNDDEKPLDEPVAQTLHLDEAESEEFEDGEIASQVDDDIPATGTPEDESYTTSLSKTPIPAEPTSSSAAAEDQKVLEVINTEPVQLSLETARDNIEQNDVVGPHATETGTLLVSEKQPEDVSPVRDHEVHDVSAYIRHLDRQITPDPSLNAFEVDVDLFKSPVAEQCELVYPKTTDVRDLGDEESLEVDFSHHESHEMAASGETQDDFEDWDLIEQAEENQVPRHDNSPKAVKRPRADDECNDLEAPVPDLKRHRSE